VSVLGNILTVGGVVGLQLEAVRRRGAVVARWLSFMQCDERQDHSYAVLQKWRVRI
jgi:hypothetical protein